MGRVCARILPLGIFLAAFLALLAPGPLAWAQCETRAGWIGGDSIDTDAERADTLQRLLDCRINLVFLTAPPLDGNLGWSDPNAFRTFVDMLVAAGISPHVWVENMSRLGWGAQADFTDPAEREAQAQWAVGLLDTYPALHGVHLDYIRYNDWADPDPRMAAVNATVQGIHTALEAAHPGKLLSAAVFIADRSWGGGDYVPQWFLDWFAANPGSIYADASGGLRYLPLQHKFQQDPITWLKDGYIDAVCPMQYTSLDSLWEQEVDLWRSFCDFVGVDFSTRVIMGVGWLREDGQPDWDYDVPAHTRHIQFGQSHALDGCSIFRLANPWAEVSDYQLIDALTISGPANSYRPPWPEPIAACFTADPLPLTARFSGDPIWGPPPLYVDFTDRSRGGPTSRLWDFGDGETSALQDPAHTYTDFGRYTVSLTVTGESASHTDTRPRLIAVGFADIPANYWAADQIIACARAGIVAGFDNLTYRPALPVSRDQMAVYIARALAGGDARVPTGPPVATFPDVPTDHWAFKYVEYAVANNVVEGYPEGNYRPGLAVDRAQMAVFIARSIVTPTGDEGLIGYTPPSTPTFLDVPTDQWAYLYIEYIAQPSVGVARGYDDGTYRPLAICTRDQMAVYVQRAFHLPI